MLFDREIVVSGLRHRLKNLMAVVEALARYSAPRSGTDAAIDDYLERFSGRLHALTAANEVALTGKPRDVEAGALVRATLAPFMSDPAPRIRVEGPSLQLSEELGGGLALAVYELATNAIRYGALSVPQGYVTFVWSKGDSATGEHVLFDWKERGGPAPLKPDREGFGMRMIRTVTARESAGKVDFDYEPDGLHCRIDLTRVPAKPRKA